VTTTIFGWDASHYDGDLTKAVLVKAKAEGIEFFTHKIGEGLSNTDTTAAQALIAARDAGIKVIGGYYFIHSGDMVAQAVRCIALADKYVPWWRDFGGWFWQTDAETDTGGHLPSPSEVKKFSDELATRSGKRVIVYASHGMYGNRLAGLGHPLWNANYPSSRRAGFKALYPGDSYAGWTAYSGQTPAICQYTSSATIAGRTTCDANAYRGTIDQLLALVATPAAGAGSPPGDDMQLTDKITLVDKPDVHYSAPTSDVGHILASTNYYVLQTRNLVSQVIGLLGDSKQLEQTIAAAVAALPAGVAVTEGMLQAAFVGAIKELAAGDPGAAPAVP
jgi:GH25 family lysozyme M1 (1,4-beta-N-acetylmuramidase)